MLTHGKKLFTANWTEQEGGGRPLMKGNGRALSDPANPLSGLRAFNRVSGPDANSCAGCHNQPWGHIGGGGDFVTNVWVQAQRFDFATFDRADATPIKGAADESLQPASLQNIGNFRATTGMFGAGYVEMLAREITEDLQTIRDTVGRGQSKALTSKGINFGKISRSADGVWNTSEVLGVSRMSLISRDPQTPPNLIIRPSHQAGNAVSLRGFTNTAFNQHHGKQSTERFGHNTDPDGDGFTNELTRADVTAVTLFEAALPVPGRVIPNDPEIEQAVLRGEQLFSKIGCAECHIPSLPLTRKSWQFTEPNPFNPPMNLRTGDTQTYRLDLQSTLLPAPRLAPSAANPEVIDVPPLHGFQAARHHHRLERPKRRARGHEPDRFVRKRVLPFLKLAVQVASGARPTSHPISITGCLSPFLAAILAHAGEARKQREAFQG